ncbi:MAG: trehalose-phosphatase [Candidatus Omnitrophica bacterium]|nr:trehalose-phosphatase [Candidatus Omnitrophota bacterium]MDD5660775.1 trehalose-phosphatase [Candidatus Omnitrophota bacterium]
MKYLFGQPARIEKLLNGRFVFILLDYDGTLVPIAKTPQKAVIPEGTKELLRKLSKRQDRAIGIISGRALGDIKRAVGIKSIIYAGNHGLEIQGPDIRAQRQVSLRIKPVMRDIAAELRRRLLPVKGVLIEDKGLTLSIHYRLVKKNDLPVFKKIFFKTSNPYIRAGKIKLNSGKKVYEIKPPVKWDKGKIVLWLASRRQFASGENRVLLVYIGDDLTDEDAFKALSGKGLTIFVGKPRNSAADYYLKNTKEVLEFLYLMLKLKKR